MLTVHGFDLPRRRGGVLQAYDTGPSGRDDELVVFWHGGTPNTGLPPEPLLADAERLGVRFVGADRPGYGGTTRDPDAPLAAVVADVAAVADHLGVARFAVLGHSGGGPRALATAALLADRVIAAAAVASPAPADADGLDRFAGTAPGVRREQEAAAAGRDALTAALAAEESDESMFTAADHAALDGPWSWFLPVVQAATAAGVEGQVDDLLEQARPWGFDPASIEVPVLLVHGGADRVVPVAHGAWLADRVPGADLLVVADAGHVSVLEHGGEVLARLRDRADREMNRGGAHHLGDEPTETGDGRATTVHLGRASVTGGFDVPGEFDLPPEEPVTLLGDVPWELREED